jgi:hypothetical protein
VGLFLGSWRRPAEFEAVQQRKCKNVSEGLHIVHLSAVDNGVRERCVSESGWKLSSHRVS